MLAVLLSSVVGTIVLGTTAGLQSAIRSKARTYYGGDLLILGYTSAHTSRIDDSEHILDVVSDTATELDLIQTAVRSSYLQPEDISLFHAGNYFGQRRIVGVDWPREQSNLQAMHLVSGVIPNDESIKVALISTVTARELNIGVGDEVVLSILSDRGRINTEDFVISGIFDETSFFGFTTYISRSDLNELREVDSREVTEIALSLQNPSTTNQSTAARSLTQAMRQENIRVFEPMLDRQRYNEEVSVERSPREYGVATLAAMTSEIEDLISAIRLIAGGIVVLFLLIIMTGISGAFKMIVWDRTQEIGTLRAMGMSRSRVAMLFLGEAAILGIVASTTGLPIGIALLGTISATVSMPETNLTSVLLIGGKLPWALEPRSAAAIVGICTLVAVVGATAAALRSAKISPAQSMRSKS